MDTFVAYFSKLPAVFSFVGQLTVVVLISFLIRWFWRNVLVRLAMKTTTNFDRLLFSETDVAVQLVFITAGLQFSWNLYGEALFEHVSNIPWIDTGFVNSVIGHVVYFALAFSLLHLARKIVFAVLAWYEQDVATKTASTLDEKIIFSLRKLFKGLFIILYVMIVAEHLEWPISKIWAAAGIGSLAVALAAKDTFANMISGVIILFDRPFLVGDRVELADGTFGDVVDIGLRSTKILSFDNTIHILPNQEISNQRITNHTYPDQNLKVAHKVGVAYGSDMAKVKSVLHDILAKHPKVRNDPPWGIWFTEFGDSSLNIFIRYWIEDYHDKFDMIDDINTRINIRFTEEGIEIPFPQRDLHIINPKPDDETPS